MAIPLFVLGSGCMSGRDSISTDTGLEKLPIENADSAKDKVELTFWHVYSDKEAAPLLELIETFNQSQNRIVVKTIGNQDATKQLVAISGGNPPDLALAYWNNVGPWADGGNVLELDSLMNDEHFDMNAFIPAAIERMKVGKHYYGLPFTMSILNTLLYNKKDFAEAGLSAPPETTEQLFDYAKKLIKKDAY